MDNLRIVEIQISNLFSDLNYDIIIPDENPIAIITAPNGRGKTTILNLISFMFDPSYDTFAAIRSVPFESFKCTLSNGKTVELRKTELVTTDKTTRVTRMGSTHAQMASRSRSPFEYGDFAFAVYKGKKSASKSVLFSRAFIEAGNLDPVDFLDEDDEDFYYSYRAQRSPAIRYKYIWKLMLSTLREEKCDIPVNFIKADRIQPVTVSMSKRKDFDEPDQVSPLDEACKKIGELITAATDQYYDAVSHAKDKLPKMFLEGEGDDLDAEGFMDGWLDYRKELTQYQDIGLITPTEDFTRGNDIQSVYQEKGKFLSTYLWAFKDTTKPLRDIYERLNLFKTILDERNAITGKRVFFSRDGVKIVAGEREIRLETLSSGEKHDFIMFYRLILGGTTNGLVLIDEPEISLHIEWQETYLDKLISICKMNGLQAIIATHSPNIVGSHYDFVVDKGESNGKSRDY